MGDLFAVWKRRDGKRNRFNLPPSMAWYAGQGVPVRFKKENVEERKCKAPGASIQSIGSQRIYCELGRNPSMSNKRQ